MLSKSVKIGAIAGVMSTQVEASEHFAAINARLQRAQERATDIVEMFLHDYEIDQVINKQAAIAQKIITDYKLEAKIACSEEIASVTAKLSEYIMLATDGTPSGFSAGLIGMGEVIYKLPMEVHQCF